MVDLLIVGTHPDDIELGFGGAVAKFVASGYEVALLDLTNGEPTPFGDPDTRAKEAAQSAAILGVKTRITLDLPNREVTDTIEARHKVAEVYRKLRPDILFIQGTEDAHPDHISGSAIALKARFDAKLTKTDMAGEPWFPKKLFHYLASHLKLHPKPSFILDVSDTFETKLNAIRTYKSQFAASGREDEFIDMLSKMGAYYGLLIGVDYGEPVFCSEEIGLKDIRDILI
jgi:bacillithiol biosynthesis deacetylase BshB1